MINHNDSMDEAFQVLEASPCPIAQAFVQKFRTDMGMTFDEKLGELEDAKDEISGLQDEIQGLEYEVEKLERVEMELNGRIENCSQLLWRFRPDVCARMPKDFGDEYEWNEYPEEIGKEYAPDYESINAAYVKSVDGEVEEVWVLPKGDMYSKRALYERVF